MPRTTTTTTTTTTVRRVVPVPKRKLVQRVRKVVIRTAAVKGVKVKAKAGIARRVRAEPEPRRIEVVEVRTLPEPKPVRKLTLKERLALRGVAND